VKKLTKKQNEIIEKIKYHSGIDINEFIILSRSNKKYLTLDTTNFKYRYQFKIEQTSAYTNMFNVLENGYNAIALV
jgi:hypothetical protein